MNQPEPVDRDVSSASNAPDDLAAFERLFAAYADRLTRYVASYVKSWETSQDIVHDVFLQYWRRQQKDEPIEDVAAYLYTLARNRALDYRRHQAVERRHRAQHASAPAEASVAAEGERHVLASEVGALVQRAIDALPKRQREVLLLRCEREAGYQEIAATLGIAVKTVDAHFQRAIHNLRKMLEQGLG
jgi:RNA polymerase sigma-70 factor (family 1)